MKCLRNHFQPIEASVNKSFLQEAQGITDITGVSGILPTTTNNILSPSILSYSSCKTTENGFLQQSIPGTLKSLRQDQKDQLHQQQQQLSYQKEDQCAYKCIVCSKDFTSQERLETHLKTHTVENPLSCTQCGKVFAQRALLKQHMRIHSDLKPFKCSVCSKSFAFNHHLTYHIRTHTGEKPFKCKVCGMTFSRKDHLRVHSRRHVNHSSSL